MRGVDQGNVAYIRSKIKRKGEHSRLGESEDIIIEAAKIPAVARVAGGAGVLKGPCQLT